VKITPPYYEVTAPCAVLPTGRHSSSNYARTKSLLKALYLWLFYKETILCYFCANGKYYRQLLVKHQEE